MTTRRLRIRCSMWRRLCSDDGDCDQYSTIQPVVRGRMMKMLLEILMIRGGQVGVILDDQEILRVALLGGLGEVEGAGEHSRAVEDHDLVVGDGVLVVDEHGDVVIEQKRRR